MIGEKITQTTRSFTEQVQTVFDALDIHEPLSPTAETEFLLRTQAEKVGYRCFSDEAAYYVGAYHALNDCERNSRRTEALAIIVARIVYNKRHTTHPLIRAEQMPGMTIEDGLVIGLVAGRMLGRLKAL